MRYTFVVVSLIGLLACGGPVRGESEKTEAVKVRAGSWLAWLESPGGRLVFELEIARDDEQGLAATIINATERIEVPTVREDGAQLVLGFDHYDSRLIVTVGAEGSTLIGEWTKTGRDGDVSKLGFRGEHGSHARRASGSHRDHRYSVWFSESGFAVAELRYFDNGGVHGTFMTPTGDYRYLSGHLDGVGRLTLSCFDGAHAFLFKADPARSTQYDLLGNFWSRDSWHEQWRAKLDPDAALPNAFDATETTEQTPDLAALVYTDLAGKKVSLADLKKDDRPMIVEVFGSWCPNCHDAAAHLMEIQKEYEKAGLVVVGLAFELTDDMDRSIAQVEKFRARHEINYPILVAGKADRAKATERIPVIDKIRSYPTAIFIDAKGKIRAVYTGYSGPATGEAHERLRAQFNHLVREMLDEVIK